jgi:hypothetical protein
MDVKALMTRKVAGVPVIYIAGLFVAILAVVAWKMKPAAEPAAEGDGPDTTADAGGVDPAAADYSSLATPGTVTVSGGSAGTTTTELPDDNDRWMRRAIEWIAGQGLATADVATIALQKYLSGDQLSMTEGKIRDAAIAHFGLPPEIPQSGGTEPTPTPGPTPVPTPNPTPVPKKYIAPGYHVVTGPADDSYTEMARLWYGRTDNAAIDLIQSYNVALGHSGPFPVGTRLWIPAYHAPKYVIAKKGMLTSSEIIAKNPPLNSVKMLTELNDGMKFPVAAGTKVRVA